MADANAIVQYMRSDTAIERFTEMMGERQARAYISSVLIAVANNAALQECTPQSILTSAMRAASLRLSCDPATGQAHLVPFKGKATLVVGYKGIKDMALRTGKYRHLNIGPVYEGETINEDRLTGMHSYGDTDRKSNKVIGWLLYFELVTGYRKTVYMTVEQIHKHAAQFSKSYQRADSPWKTHTEAMEKKTLLRLGLTQWGYFDQNDAEVLRVTDDAEPIDAAMVEEMPQPAPAAPAEPRTLEQNMEDLGF